MTIAALGLVVIAAFAHASWNYHAKRASGGGLVFVWLYTVAKVAIYAPVVVLIHATAGSTVSWLMAGLVAGSSVLHTGYFLLLQRGYLTGELSLVYPIARGIGPLLAVVGAIWLLGERPPLLAYLGVIGVCAGVLWLASVGSKLTTPRAPEARSRGVGYALLTGVFIAGYTVWDAHAMNAVAMSPIIYQWGSNVGRLLMISPRVLSRHAGSIRPAWAAYRNEILWIAVLAPLSYMLVLTAYTLAPVSYVAPARELSIVFGTALGAVILKESGGLRRLPAAATIVLGVILLSVA